MTFFELAKYFEKLENTPSRNQMTVILAELFGKSSVSDIGQICYLLQGRVVPLYESLEFGMADKKVIKAISEALEIDETKVNTIFKKEGDLGETVSSIKCQVSGSKFVKLSINDVYGELLKMAKISGTGSEDEKTKILGDLIKNTEALSAKFIIRIVLGKLRMGFSDMTILDALSWMLTGSKKEKKLLETAYNVRPDLGYIAQISKKEGIVALKKVLPSVGVPIRMAKADRLSSADDIFKKIGKCAVEFKYDGLRLQVHYEKRQGSSVKRLEEKHLIKLFSRNLEDVTLMFPDVCEAVQKQIKCQSAIFEGEVCAYNPQTGAWVPFQETMQRKRKYDIAKKALEIPVKLFAFELLYCDGKNFIDQGYLVRKNKLKQILSLGKTIIYAQEKIIKNVSEIDDMFDQSVKENYEGIIAKKLDGKYDAGVRGWNWIKYKKAMNSKLADTIDVLVMGYSLGEGRRTSFGMGQFLTGIYDKKNDKFLTITKIGTGIVDLQFKEFAKRIEGLKIKEKPTNYMVDKLLYPDFWLKPKLVVEIGGDEITRTSVHTAGREMVASKSGASLIVKNPGYALRFPRLKRFRDDKNPTDITTLEEIKSMFSKQKK